MNALETTPLIDIELNKVELLIDSLSEFSVLLHELAWVWVLVSGMFVLLSWFIFRYHEHRIADYDFFKDNIHVVGRFTSKTFDMFRWWSMTFPPLAVFVVCFSVWTRFDTLDFIRAFGTRRVQDN